LTANEVASYAPVVMSFQVGRAGVLALVVAGCSGVADPMGLSAAGGDLQTVPDAGHELDSAPTGAPTGSTPAADAGHAAVTHDAQSAEASIDAAAGGDAGPDEVALDAGASDATLVDVGSATTAEAGAASALEAASEAGDAAVAASGACWVTFTVADAFIDGVIDTNVAIGGDTPAFGNWDPDAAAPMTSIGAGAWTVSLVLNDGDEVQFLFVKRGPGTYAWEDWGVNSNRSLVVACSPDADVGDVVDGGPATGTSYAGQFDVKPPDAT
jgi:hypothetical protein